MLSVLRGLCVVFLLCGNAFATTQIIGSGIISPLSGGGSCPTATSFFARSDVTTALNALPSGQATEKAAYQADMNTLVCNGAAHGWLSNLDVLNVYAAPSPALALINVASATIGNSTLSTASVTAPYTNNPMFISETGFLMTGNTPESSLISYINTNYNPGSGSGSPQFTQNAGSFGACNLTKRIGFAETWFSISNGIFSGAGSLMVPGATVSGGGLIQQFNVGSTSAANSTVNPNGAQGLLVADRSSSSSFVGYLNGVQVGSSTNASNAVPNASFILGVENNGGTLTNAGSSDFFAEAMVGGHMTATQQASMAADIHTYNVKRGLTGC